MQQILASIACYPQKGIIYFVSQGYDGILFNQIQFLLLSGQNHRFWPTTKPRLEVVMPVDKEAIQMMMVASVAVSFLTAMSVTSAGLKYLSPVLVLNGRKVLDRNS